MASIQIKLLLQLAFIVDVSAIGLSSFNSKPNLPNKAEQKPGEVSDLEAAVQAKYKLKVGQMANTLDGADLEAAVQANRPEVPLEGAKPESEAGNKAEAQAEQPEAKAGAPSDVAALEAAVQAKFHFDERESATEGKAEAQAEQRETKDANLPADVAQLEAAVQTKYKLVEAKPETDAGDNEQSAARQAEFESLSMKEVKARAREAGLTEASIEEAEEQERPKLALIDMIVKKMQVAVRREQLETLSMKAVKAKAREVGLTQADIEEAEEEEKPKLAIINKILNKNQVVPDSKSSALQTPKSSQVSSQVPTWVPSWLSSTSHPQSPTFQQPISEAQHQTPRVDEPWTEASDHKGFPEAARDGALQAPDHKGFPDTAKDMDQAPAKVTKLKVAVQASPETEVKSLEAAVQAKYHTDQPLERQAEAQSPMPTEVDSLEAAVQAKYHSETPEESKTESKANGEAEAIINPEPSAATSSAKAQFRLKVEAEAKTKLSSTSSKDEGEGRKPQRVTMHELPHYRKHGAAFAHVEPASRQRNSSTSNKSSAKESLFAKRPEADAKAELAAKRAEVENYFHLSKSTAPQDAQPASQAEEPVRAGRSILASIFSLAALCSLVGIAYHKYELILKFCDGQHGPSKFKAKQEDFYSIEGSVPTPPPRYAQENIQGWSTTRFATQCSNLGRLTKRASATDSMNSCDSGV